MGKVMVCLKMIWPEGIDISETAQGAGSFGLKCFGNDIIENAARAIAIRSPAKQVRGKCRRFS
ncbi:hypothetical protein [Shinella zoogloeoides]